MARPNHRDRRQAGVTLLEVMVATALLSVVVAGVLVMTKRMEDSRRLLAAKSDAQSQGHLLLDRVTAYFRTRMALRPDNGFRIAPCAQPGPTSRCLEIVRRRRGSAAGAAEVGERFVVKSACRPLSANELGVLSRLQIPREAMAESLKPLCGFTCKRGERPVVNLRHFPDDKVAAYNDFEFPPKARFNEGMAASAGFCVRRRGPDEVHLAQGFTYLRDEGKWSFKLLRKDAVLTLGDDNSKIEWVP